MQRYWIWLILGCTLTGKAIVLMGAATVMKSEFTAHWALLVAMAACMCFCKVLCDRAAERERLRIEDLAAIMAREAARTTTELRPVPH